MRNMVARLNSSAITMIMAVVWVILLLMPSSALAQGSIFGTVTNSNSSTPANGEMSFFGYLDDTDEEIRIETSIGAGYDEGFWYDDFQNYLTEVAGNPYDYHFYNLVNHEGVVLSKLIPNNSYQEENILLAPLTWPDIPEDMAGRKVSASAAVISWKSVPDLTYHIYRRTAPSNGSLFRIDDTTGSLLNPGVPDSFFVDTTIDDTSDYHYLVIAEDAAGNLSPHSSVFNLSSGAIMAPVITAISPNTGTSKGGTAVSITGTGFDIAGATVTIDGVALTSLVVVSPFEITGITPAGPAGPADVVVTNTVSGLSSDPLAGGYIYQPKNPPVVADIPDQAIIGDGSFAAINLDDYVDDLDDPDSMITWSYSGVSDLSVDITDRIATIIISNMDWPGTESIVFQATDPDLRHDEDTVTFVQAKVNAPDLDFGDILVGRTGSVGFSITTPDGFTIASPQIIPSHASVTMHRADGGDVDDDIPPSSVVTYWAVWTPSDTGDSPGSVTISSTSLDDDEQLDLTGRAISLVLAPDVASHDFGDVNSLDIRAADTIRIEVNVSGNVGGTITALTIGGSANDYRIVAPIVGDSLIVGAVTDIVILSHPQSIGSTTGDVWINYDINLSGTILTDSANLIALSAVGVEPGCSIIQDTVDYNDRRIGTVNTRPFTLSNSSTVIEVIDSIYFDSNSDIFWVDPGPGWPMFISPGDTDLTVYFKPLAETSYTANMIIVDSMIAGDCDPPVVRGTGIPAEIHWEADAPLSMGLVRLCDSAVTADFRITNQTSGYDLIIDGIEIDSSGWLVFYPDPSTLIGSAYTLSETIVFDSIVFIPQDILASTALNLTLIYHVDTIGAPNDTFLVAVIDQTGGCAGILETISELNYGSGEVWNTIVDTITMTNSGGCDLVIESYMWNNQDFNLQGDSITFLMTAGSQFNLEVSFTPTNSGLIEDQLIISHHGYQSPFDPDTDCPLSNQTVINLSGIGTDISPPQIQSVTSSSCGNILEIRASDVGTGIESVSSLWRRGNALGGFAGTTNSPEFMYSNLWQLQFSESDLSADSVNILGYEIMIIVADGAGNTDTAFQPVGGCISDSWDGGRKISAEKWLGGDGLDSLWHLVSIPGNLPTYQVHSIFEQSSGLPPARNVPGDSWRLYEYHDKAFRTLPTNDPAAVIQPGHGYWFRHIRVLDTLRLDPSGTAFTWPTLSSFEIPLDFGWNLIGSPFLFPAFINDTLIDTDSVSSFLRQSAPASPGGKDWWVFSGIGAALPALEPWKGYAIWCENRAGYSIYLDPHYNPLEGPTPDPQGWATSVSLSTPSSTIGHIEIGINTNSSNGPDLADVRSVTLFNKSNSLNIDNEPHGLFMRDIRPADGLQVWRLDLSGENDKPLVISWPSPSIVNSDNSLVLLDAVTGNSIDMLSQTEYHVENPSQLPRERFSVLYGDKDIVKSAIETGSPAHPLIFRLYQNYPNPFNPETTISFDLPKADHVKINIYNILGQRVRTLIDKRQDAGSYQVIWDGRDSMGQNIATGIYFARLLTGDNSATIKMSLIK